MQADGAEVLWISTAIRQIDTGGRLDTWLWHHRRVQGRSFAPFSEPILKVPFLKKKKKKCGPLRIGGRDCDLLGVNRTKTRAVGFPPAQRISFRTPLGHRSWHWSPRGCPHLSNIFQGLHSRDVVSSEMTVALLYVLVKSKFQF